MKTRKASLAWSVLAIVTLLSLVLAACGPNPTESPAPPTEAPPSCEYQADKEIVATADDGSKAKVRVDTCIEPPPGGEQVRVESRTPGDWGLTNEQLKQLEKKGKIWSMLDITPDNRTWAPPIIVWFTLKEPAPYDDFRLTICQWSELQQDWRRAGTATAYKKDDQQAKGEITHTTLFALVAEEAETVVVPNVVGRHVDEAREIFFAAGLQVGEHVGEEAPGQELGAVVWQSLDPGTEVDPGTRVDLGVAVSYEIPYVVGMNMEEAAATLHEAGFELGQIFEEQVSDYEPGTVLQQSPQGGEEVSSGTPVHLMVAIPKERVVVPNVEGLHLNDAIGAIQGAGLQVGRIVEEVSDYEPGTVLRQSPRGGEEVSPGTPVDLVVTMPEEKVVVPDVVGLLLDYAIGVIEEAALQVGQVREQESEQEPGTVLEQSPRGGEEVSPGTPVDLVVAIPEPTVTVVVPDVMRLPLDYAIGVIEEAALQVGQVREQESGQEPGTVLEQSPRGGEKVSSGTPVDLVVAIPRTRYALQFDGVDDFVSIVDTGRFDFDYAFTLEAWVKPLSLTGRGGFKAIVQGAFSEPPFTGGGWVMALDRSDYSDWALSVCVPGCDAAKSGSGGLQIGQWQHLAARYDGTEIVIYRDGKEVASESHSGNVSDINYVLVGIWSESFNGLIDDVRIWDIARTQSEIQADMYRTLSGGEGGLVGYWRFDEGGGQVVFDSTPYQHNGRVNGRLGSSPEGDANDPVWVVSDAPID